MLLIYTDQTSAQLTTEIIDSVEGLSAHINILDLADLTSGASDLQLIIDKGMIEWPLNWDDTEPPILMDAQPLNEDNLVALIMTKLGHFDLALLRSIEDNLRQVITSYASLVEGSEVYDLATPISFTSIHNEAVIRHYKGITENGQSLSQIYKKALNMAPDVGLRAFTARQYAIYLLDNNQNELAEEILRLNLENDISTEATQALKFDLINLLAKRITIPYDHNLIEELKRLLWEAIKSCEATNRSINLAMLLTRASEVANIENSYSESLGYINRAIDIYKYEHLEEFLAAAFLRKGTLLYTWAQDGNPQFYKTAIETYQEALKIFKKDSAPAIFAEIHHNLGVIYAEIRADEKQKLIWSAVSASSFKESLQFFTKEAYPYEYAMVLNNYANALMKYPESRNADNYEKAISFLLEALEIRSADLYPLERAHTILNYLEACWRVNNVNRTMERVRLKDMFKKANEVRQLVQDEVLIKQADEHLVSLKELEKSLLVTQ